MRRGSEGISERFQTRGEMRHRDMVEKFHHQMSASSRLECHPQTPIAAPAKCASGETSCRRRRRAERRAEQHQCRVMVQKATCRWSSSSHRQTSRSSSFLSTPSCDIMHAKMTSHDSMRTISSIHCTRLAMPCRVSNQGLAFESCVWDRSWAAGNQRSSFFSSHPFSPAIRRRHGTSESEGVLQFSGELGFSRVETQAAGFIL